MSQRTLISCICIAVAISMVNAGCQPELAFAPPKLTPDSLKGTFDTIRSTIDGLAAKGVFNVTSFSLRVASSTQDLFSLSRAADTPFGKGTKTVDGDSIFRVASNTKLFTALGILRLAAVGKLNLDHGVSRYVSGLRDSASTKWSQITIRNLLSHLSGISDNCEQYAKQGILLTMFQLLIMICSNHCLSLVCTDFQLLRPRRHLVSQHVKHSRTLRSRVPSRVGGDFPCHCEANRSKISSGIWQ
jgi:hypothetical protein